MRKTRTSPRTEALERQVVGRVDGVQAVAGEFIRRAILPGPQLALCRHGGSKIVNATPEDAWLDMDGSNTR